MTSNCPAVLNPALKRPGRIDLQVEFTLASGEQIRQIYARMYALPKTYHSADAAAGVQLRDCIELKTDHQSQELIDMAETFAKHLPPLTVSPAEVQGFLLKYKDFPKSALERVCEWRDELLATRDDEIEMSKRKQTHRLGL
jgi:chaperone BCS1